MSMQRSRLVLILAVSQVLLLALAGPAFASGGIDGAQLSLPWALPFACMLLSIAVLPLALPSLWGGHYGKIALFWALAFLVPCAVLFGPLAALGTLAHTIVLEYLPFLILIFALFTISGGVRLTGNLSGTPKVNTIVLAIGTLLASLMGTTGAAMLLIRPLLRANAHRKHKVHTVVFFIFLVANIGGSLTPLGDPPLFLGFLQGVHFFWTTSHLFHEMLFASCVLLVVYYGIESRMFAREDKETVRRSKHRGAIGVEGKANLVLLLGVIGAVLLSGVWNPGLELRLGEIEIGVQDLARDVLLLALAGLSLRLTSKETREENNFSWEPMEEVAKLFFGIFVTMIPAIAMLRAGANGALAPVVALVVKDGVPANHMYFWLSGILSSFLDNAPTYLVFFNTAGGDAAKLMTEAPLTLAAISCGSVFMGANSYIGNAPNFMVRSIAESQGVKMPSFFGYMAWSCGILVPLFLVITFVFFQGA